MSNTKIAELQSKLTETQSNLASIIESISKQEAKITRLQAEAYKLSQKARTPGLSFDIKSNIETDINAKDDEIEKAQADLKSLRDKKAKTANVERVQIEKISITEKIGRYYTIAELYSIETDSDFDRFTHILKEHKHAVGLSSLDDLEIALSSNSASQYSK
ncbi:TPA: hypothetical protein NID02_001603 [Pseudomonas aeruginosa]|nr:hypothetical protein [Pseudomonas aeruginosa]